MKKYLAIILCLLMLSAIAIFPVSATENEEVKISNPDKVVDMADILTDNEEQKLEDRANEIIEEHSLDVVIVIVYSLDGKTATAYADDYYDYNSYGVGSDFSGVLFLLSMEERDWAISTSGNAIRRLSDNDLDDIFAAARSSLSNDQYYKAFDRYLDALDGKLDYQYRENNGDDDTTKLIAGIVINFFMFSMLGALIAFVTLGIMKKKMVTAVKQKNAGNYVVDGSYQLLRHTDTFLYSRTTKRRKEQSSSGGGSRSSSGSRSSTHRSSSGRSHGGRSGKF